MQNKIKNNFNKINKWLLINYREISFSDFSYQKLK